MTSVKVVFSDSQEINLSSDKDLKREELYWLVNELRKLNSLNAIDSSRIDHKLDSIINLINQTGERIIMALSAAEQTIVDRFNTATSAVAAKIQQLIDNPPADDAEFNARLQELADGLDKLGQPGQPLPPPA